MLEGKGLANCGPGLKESGLLPICINSFSGTQSHSFILCVVYDCCHTIRKLSSSNRSYGLQDLKWLVLWPFTEKLPISEHQIEDILLSNN